MSWIRSASGDWQKRPELKDCFEILRSEEEHKARVFRGFPKAVLRFRTNAEFEAWMATLCSCAPGLKDKSHLLHNWHCRAMREIAKLGAE